MPEKKQHFITIITPKGESVTVDIGLSKEEYELVNRICVLFDATADINQPVLAISKPIPEPTKVSDLHTNPPTGAIPIVSPIPPIQLPADADPV